MIPRLLQLAYKYKTYLKYGLSGGTAAFTDLVLLYGLTDVFGLYYLASAVIAYLCAYFVSFYLQKFWTFRDDDTSELGTQMSIYFLNGLVSLGINTAGMLALVSGLHVPYILAQIILSLLISIGSFLFYNFVVFRKKRAELKAKANPVRPPKMRLVIATGIYPPDSGGPATYTFHLGCALPTRDIAVDVVTYSDKVPGVREHINGRSGQGDAVPVHRVSRRWPLPLRYVYYCFNVLKLIPGYDLVYVQDPVSAGLPAAVAARLAAKPYVLKVVGDYAWEQGRQRFGVTEALDDFEPKRYGKMVRTLWRIECYVAGHAAAIVTPSAYLKRHVVRAWGIAPEKVIVIPNAVELPASLPDRAAARSKLKLSGTVLVSIGRLVPWKGFAMLIRILPSLAKRFPDLNLQIVGGGPLRQDLEKAALEAGVADKVSFIGRVLRDQALTYLAAADLFLLNTEYEGLSHLIIEAQAAGTPALVSEAGGNHESVTDNETGCLLPVNDETAWTEAITALLADPERREHLARNAKAAAGSYTAEMMVGRTVEVLMKVTGKGLKSN